MGVVCVARPEGGEKGVSAIAKQNNGQVSCVSSQETSLEGAGARHSQRSSSPRLAVISSCPLTSRGCRRPLGRCPGPGIGASTALIRGKDSGERSSHYSKGIIGSRKVGEKMYRIR